MEKLAKCSQNLSLSLTLAAEVGHTLLAENQKLRQDVLDLTFKNSQLLRKAEEHLSKERRLREDLAETFEEQDLEKETLITNQEKEINRLQAVVKKQKRMQTEEHKKDVAKTFKDVGMQTSSTRQPEPSYSTDVLAELAQLKISQEGIEKHVPEVLTNPQSSPVRPTSYPAQLNQNKKGKTSGDLAKITKQLDHKSNTEDGNPLISDSFRNNAQNQERSSKKICNVPTTQRPHVSISLQVAKHRGNLNAITPSNRASTNPSPIKISNPPISKGPPMNAKKRMAGESYEDIFNKHIQFYKELLRIAETKPHDNDQRQASNLELENHPLLPQCEDQQNTALEEVTSTSTNIFQLPLLALVLGFFISSTKYTNS
ncbi:hypothetical protein J6590_075288 [Homalodisca vitripennis]|nr:hypothetical protein J6590_075288 [Homalodisca vitripennis]